MLVESNNTNTNMLNCRKIPRNMHFSSFLSIFESIEVGNLINHLILGQIAVLTNLKNCLTIETKQKKLLYYYV